MVEFIPSSMKLMDATKYYLHGISFNVNIICDDRKDNNE